MDNTYLRLKGFRFDRVVKFPPFEPTAPPDTLYREAKEIGLTYTATGESSIKALITVAHADLSNDIQEAVAWIMASQRERQTLSTPSKYQPGLDREIDLLRSGFVLDAVSSAEHAMSGRKYFVSNYDYIGLVPEATQEGDMICIFMGGKTPFVVRPVGEHYQLIGASYVHGIMYGEAMEQFITQGWEMQDFVLI